MIRQQKPQTKEENERYLKQEEAFKHTWGKASDEELLTYLCSCAEALGHMPKRHEIIGCELLKKRFGAWPRVLEKAGLKEKTRKE